MADIEDDDDTSAYLGPERRKTDRRATTLGLVEDAAERAATSAVEKVGGIHRRRLALWCFLGALAASCAIALPVVLALDQARRSDSVANSRFNCSQWHEGATVLALFIASDAQLRRDQQNLANQVEVRSGLNQLFGAGTLKRLTSQSKELDRAAQSYWTHRLVPRLEKLANINCDQVITSDGVKTTTTSPGVTTPTITSPLPTTSTIGG